MTRRVQKQRRLFPPASFGFVCFVVELVAPGMRIRLVVGFSQGCNHGIQAPEQAGFHDKGFPRCGVPILTPLLTDGSTYMIWRTGARAVWTLARLVRSAFRFARLDGSISVRILILARTKLSINNEHRRQDSNNPLHWDISQMQ
jgi:hypothetical protein